jgi:hypothetical protein
LGNFCMICFLIKRGVSETASASVFRQWQHLICWAPYIQLFWVTGQYRLLNLSRNVVPENRPCTSTVPGRWLSKNELEDLKAEDGQGRKQKKIMLVRYVLRDIWIKYLSHKWKFTVECQCLFTVVGCHTTGIYAYAVMKRLGYRLDNWEIQFRFPAQVGDFLSPNWLGRLHI